MSGGPSCAVPPKMTATRRMKCRRTRSERPTCAIGADDPCRDCALRTVRRSRKGAHDPRVAGRAHVAAGRPHEPTRSCRLSWDTARAMAETDGGGGRSMGPRFEQVPLVGAGTSPAEDVDVWLGSSPVHSLVEAFARTPEDRSLLVSCRMSRGSGAISTRVRPLVVSDRYPQQLRCPVLARAVRQLSAILLHGNCSVEKESWTDGQACGHGEPGGITHGGST